MRILLYIFIAFFILLLVWPIGSFGSSLVEGLENGQGTTTTGTTTEGSPTSQANYQPYNLNDPNNALILAQQNAGNIDYLKGRVDELYGIKKDVDDLKMNVSSMQTQIDGLVQQQADYATEIAGSQPPEINGLEEEEEQL